MSNLPSVPALAPQGFALQFLTLELNIESFCKMDKIGQIALQTSCCKLTVKGHKILGPGQIQLSQGTKYG